MAPAYYPSVGSVAPIQVGSAMPIHVGSAAPWGAPRTIQTVRSVNYGYSAAPHIVPLNQPGTVSIVKQSQSVGQLASVGFSIEHRPDQMGGFQKVVGQVYPEGAAENWNKNNPDDKINPGDVLVEVNGERVAHYDLTMLSALVKGPYESAVVLRMRSLKDDKEFEAELMRTFTVEKAEVEGSNVWLHGSVVDLASHGSVAPMSPSKQPKDATAPPAEEKREPKNEEEKYQMEHDERIMKIKSFGEKLTCPGFSIEPVGDKKTDGYGFMIGNVTKGSQAYEFGFRHGEVIEGINGVSVKGFDVKQVKSLLMDTAYTTVQVHTDKRIVPVTRDCDAEPTLFKGMPMPGKSAAPQQSAAPMGNMRPMSQAPMSMPRMPRVPRDDFVPYFEPAMPTRRPPPQRHMMPYAPGPHASFGHGSVAPLQDYGFMDPPSQPNYTTVQVHAGPVYQYGY